MDLSRLAFCLGERLSFSCPLKTHVVDKQFEGASGTVRSKRRTANFTLRFTRKPSHIYLKQWSQKLWNHTSSYEPTKLGLIASNFPFFLVKMWSVLYVASMWCLSFMSLTEGLRWAACQRIKRLYNYSCIKISLSHAHLNRFLFSPLTLVNLYVLKPSRHLSICKVSDIIVA